jgi:hypothetical protein
MKEANFAAFSQAGRPGLQQPHEKGSLGDAAELETSTTNKIYTTERLNTCIYRRHHRKGSGMEVQCLSVYSELERRNLAFASLP